MFCLLKMTRHIVQRLVVLNPIKVSNCISWQQLPRDWLGRQPHPDAPRTVDHAKFVIDWLYRTTAACSRAYRITFI
jgi:hypothetical protein